MDQCRIAQLHRRNIIDIGKMMPPSLDEFLKRELAGSNLDGVRLEASPTPYWRSYLQSRLARIRSYAEDGVPYPVEDDSFGPIE